MSIVEGAQRVAKSRNERVQAYRRAAKVAHSLFDKTGPEGVKEHELVLQVQKDAGVVEEVAVYVVDELRAQGFARKDRETRILYRR